MSETIGLLGVSVVSNGLALGLFATLRWVMPDHTPNVSQLAIQGWMYVTPRVGYVLLWSIEILLASCLIAYLLSELKNLKPIARLFTPVILDESAWYHVLEKEAKAEDGKQCFQYVRCALEDGSCIAGRLAYYSTDTKETSDRDIALTDPFEGWDAGGAPINIKNTFVIISARQIKWIAAEWHEEDKKPRDPSPTFAQRIRRLLGVR